MFDKLRSVSDLTSDGGQVGGFFHSFARVSGQGGLTCCRIDCSTGPPVSVVALDMGRGMLARSRRFGDTSLGVEAAPAKLRANRSDMGPGERRPREIREA